MLASLRHPGRTPCCSPACAAVPGYTPPPFKETSKHGKPLESGDVQADGQYEMSADEKAMDCKRLTGSMQIAISRLRDRSGRVEPSASAREHSRRRRPCSAAPASARIEGVYARERAKLEAYNRELAARNCKTLDIEAELARAPDQPGKKY